MSRHDVYDYDLHDYDLYDREVYDIVTSLAIRAPAKKGDLLW